MQNLYIQVTLVKQDFLANFLYKSSKVDKAWW